MYLKMVKGEDDSVYCSLSSKFKGLVAKLTDPNKTTVHGITYIETMLVEDFEKKNQTVISINVTKPKAFFFLPNTAKEYVEEARIKSSEKFVPRRYASFSLGGKKQIASINKSVTKDDEECKEQLSISRCRNSKGELFWLLHKNNKITVPNASLVDINELNNDLDLLLNM